MIIVTIMIIMILMIMIIGRIPGRGRPGRDGRRRGGPGQRGYGLKLKNTTINKNTNLKKNYNKKKKENNDNKKKKVRFEPTQVGPLVQHHLSNTRCLQGWRIM